MVPEDLTRLAGVSDPQISPDGRWIAFVVAKASAERDETLANVWIIDAAGGEPRRFTSGPARD
jgi:tricorn protease-like protein